MYKTVMQSLLFINNSFSYYQKMIDEYNLNKFCILHTRFIKEEDVKYYYAAADLVVLPYTKIYQSGVLLMSLSYNKPTIVSDLLPLIDIITHNETGFVFKNNDDVALSEKINDIFLSEKDFNDKNIDRVAVVEEAVISFAASKKNTMRVRDSRPSLSSK